MCYAPPDAWNPENNKPEDMKKGQETWMNWSKKVGSALVEMGSPFGNGKMLSLKGSSSSDTGVTGYSIMQGDSIKDVEKMLHGHPHLKWMDGCRIEVLESMPMAG